MKKLVFAASAAALFAAASSSAEAGGCPGGYCQQPGPFQGGLFSKSYKSGPMPAFQAAPWYLYWPYNAHFMTPAPLAGAPFYAPPTAAGGLHNPYFPGGR